MYNDTQKTQGGLIRMEKQINKSFAIEEKLDQLAHYAFDLGLRALSGEPGETRDSLIYSGAIMLCNLNHSSLNEAADIVRTLLDSGAALSKFNQHP